MIGKGGLLESKLKAIGAEHFTLNVATKNPLKWFFIRKQVKTILKAVNADIVHVESRVPAWIALEHGQKSEDQDSGNNPWSFQSA